MQAIDRIISGTKNPAGITADLPGRAILPKHLQGEAGLRESRNPVSTAERSSIFPRNHALPVWVAETKSAGGCDLVPLPNPHQNVIPLQPGIFGPSSGLSWKRLGRRGVSIIEVCVNEDCDKK